MDSPILDKSDEKVNNTSMENGGGHEHMNQHAVAVIEDCRLTDSQRTVILSGIDEGKREFSQTMEAMPKTSTRTYAPRLLYELVNTHVEEAILKNPQLNLSVERRMAGFYPYIVVRDIARNIAALVLPIPSNKDFEPCLFRGDFAIANIDRLMAMGVTEEDLGIDMDHQLSLPFGIEHLPFGLIVSYDREKNLVCEGALQPSQEQWLFNEDVTDKAVVGGGNVVSFPQQDYDDSDISIGLSQTALQESERDLNSKNNLG